MTRRLVVLFGAVVMAVPVVLVVGTGYLRLSGEPSPLDVRHPGLSRRLQRPLGVPPALDNPPVHLVQVRARDYQ